MLPSSQDTTSKKEILFLETADPSEGSTRQLPEPGDHIDRLLKPNAILWMELWSVEDDQEKRVDLAKTQTWYKCQDINLTEHERAHIERTVRVYKFDEAIKRERHSKGWTYEQYTAMEQFRHAVFMTWFGPRRYGKTVRQAKRIKCTDMCLCGMAEWGTAEDVDNNDIAKEYALAADDNEKIALCKDIKAALMGKQWWEDEKLTASDRSKATKRIGKLSVYNVPNILKLLKLESGDGNKITSLIQLHHAAFCYKNGLEPETFPCLRPKRCCQPSRRLISSSDGQPSVPAIVGLGIFMLLFLFCCFAVQKWVRCSRPEPQRRKSSLALEYIAAMV